MASFLDISLLVLAVGLLLLSWRLFLAGAGEGAQMVIAVALIGGAVLVDRGHSWAALWLGMAAVLCLVGVMVYDSRRRPPARHGRRRSPEG